MLPKILDLVLNEDFVDKFTKQEKDLLDV